MYLYMCVCVFLCASVRECVFIQIYIYQQLVFRVDASKINLTYTFLHHKEHFDVVILN